MRPANTYRGHPERVDAHKWQTQIQFRRLQSPPVRANVSRHRTTALNPNYRLAGRTFRTTACSHDSR